MLVAVVGIEELLMVVDVRLNQGRDLALGRTQYWLPHQQRTTAFRTASASGRAWS